MSVLALVGMVFFFSFFEISSVGPSLPKVIAEHHSTTTAAATAVSLGLWGYIIGSPLNSIVADRLGRRAGLLTAIVLYGLGALGTAASTSMLMFTIFRVVGGMGVGASIAVISTYISELSPAARRGRSMAMASLPAQFGSAVTPFIAVWLVPSYSWGWRVLLAIPVVATLIFLFGYRLLPESPRWLVATGRYDAADRAVEKAEKRASREVGALPEIVPTKPDTPMGDWRSQILLLVRRPNLRWTLTFLLVWACQTMPAYGIGGLGITLLTQHGLSLTHSIQLTFGQSAGLLLGGLAALRVGDRWPRKWVAAIIALLPATGLLALGLYPSNWMILIGFGLVSFQTGLASAVVYLLTAEHFPTHIRSTGVALSNGAGHIGGAIAPLLAVAVYAAWDFAAVWITFGMIFVVYALAISTTRLTTGRTLDDLRDGEPPTVAESHPQEA
ncbi:MFS transporter [Amycolatopsis pigmentata]|uniref:MFS transporter n=1 Tax=Amycolatopsis pigmentata TaxID=450801 RepID=A0ABW5FNF9_9PSEU